MSSKKSKSKNRKKPQRTRRVAPTHAMLANVAVADRFEVMLKLKPTPAKDERDEDLAIFSRAARERLSAELQAEAEIVATALEMISKGDYPPALESLACIARSSPYAQWRLFLRGLVAFYQGDLAGSRANWGRLDPTRRPARMAAVLNESEGGLPLGEEAPPAPRRQVSIARDLRLRTELLAKARKIAAEVQANPEEPFSVSQVQAILALYKDLRRLDSDFVLAFCQACMLWTFSHGHPEPLLVMKQCIPGPAHDPGWNLHVFQFFFGVIDSTTEQAAAADQYIHGDLPRVESITKELANALASEVRLKQAMYDIFTSRQSFGFGLFRPRVDLSAAEAHLEESVKFYPNREAHRELVSLVDQQYKLLSAGAPPGEARKAQIEKKLINAKAALVKNFPDELDTLLELIDHYFEEGEFAKASELVSQLDGQRLDDPRARVMPWKLKLLEAMHASRLKGGLKESCAALDAAEQIWPSWLSKDWLCFLRAAVALRGGDQAEFERLHAMACQACGGESLATDMMTYAAIQQMNVVSAAVKPWRARLEAHLQTKLSRESLLQLGAFCWDIARARLHFRGYHLYSTKFGKQLNKLFKSEKNWELTDLLRRGCLWAGEHRFWEPDPNTYTPPKVLHEMTKVDAYIAAACFGPYNSLRSSGQKALKARPQIDMLAEAAKNERDPFYRYHFESVSQGLLSLALEYEEYERQPYRF